MQFPERVCKRQHHAPYVEEIECKCSKILAGNKTMLIIPDLTLTVDRTNIIHIVTTAFNGA